MTEQMPPEDPRAAIWLVAGCVLVIVAIAVHALTVGLR